MRININNQVFGQGKLTDVLSKDVDILLLKENDWFLKNNYASGFVKDIRSEGVCFLSYKLSMYKNDELFVSHDAPLFKLHFEFEGDVKYTSGRSENNVSKGTYELLYMVQDCVKIESERISKNSVEIFFDEVYLKKIAGNAFVQLLSMLKKETSIQNGLFITDEVLKIISDINNCDYTGCKRKVYLELKIKELIIVSITFYEEHYNSEIMLELDSQIFQNVDNYIKQNLKKELTIQDLSIIAGMNTSKFKRCFKQLYGTTVFKYITSLRIDKAKMLIQQKAYTISQASYEVGYKNSQHFTVAFKKNMGYLPKELKKK